MDRTRPVLTVGWSTSASRNGVRQGLPDYLLRVVDAALVGVICVAPFFFGGRHDLGRLVLVSLVAVASVAWFARQALMPAAAWPKTVAYAILSIAVLLLVLQIIALPTAWIAHLSPATAELLPLWTSNGAEGASLGSWQTLSLMPHATTKSLAMLLSYILLFVVVAGRIQGRADVQWLMMWIGVSAAAMALFGLTHYFTSSGRYFWFYDHPHRTATRALSGAFINRNHFASFLVLSVGPLLACLLHLAARPARAANQRLLGVTMPRLGLWMLSAALVLVTLAVLGSCSRGGAIVLLLAGATAIGIYFWRGLVDVRFFYGLLGVGVLVVALLSLHGYDQVVQRLDDFAEGSIDEIDEGGIRRTLWSANLAAFKSLWLTGAGAGSHREICPVYLPQSFTKEYTHAENGYLQVASETGTAGVLLLIAGLGVCGAWCVTGLRHASQPEDVRLMGAGAASLAASAAHSVVDFVWYIPACMSLTVVVAACVLRLSQLVRSTETQTAGVRVLTRGRWMELAAAALLVAGWTVHVYVGPGVAAVHWNRYLRASVANTQLSWKEMHALVNSRPVADTAEREPLNDVMIRHLEQAVKWDPHFARAHLRLAAKYMTKFELAQQQAENSMGLAQLRDAALASNFSSPERFHAWLERAFGANTHWLHRAETEARHALRLCPLQGAGYIYLADLSFLDSGHAAGADAFIEQALRVRPRDGDVLYAVGDQAWRNGDIEAAIGHWSECFSDTGAHQLRIVYRLAGQVPAQLFLSTFRPDWRTLYAIWSRYRERSRPEDVESLLAYTLEATRRETQRADGIPPAQIWYRQSLLFADVGRSDEALACLEQAYASDPTLYHVRRTLAQALESAGRFAEAEPHVRWCLARRPADKGLSRALVTISKQRLAERDTSTPPIRSAVRATQARPEVER